jgi:LAGLIDADG endonuclease
LNCGSVEIPSTRIDSAKFVVYKFSDITEKIIPFFKKYPLRTVKLLNFDDFIKVSDLMKEGSHLTKEGIEKISLIKKGMNVGRVFE